MKAQFTHAGWFGICPVLLGDLDGDAPLVHPRHWLLAPLFWLSEALMSAAIAVMSALRPDYEPLWSIVVTAELPQPLAVDLEIRP